MAPPIVTLREIRLSFGGTPLLEDAELAVSRGERLCLVGRNGSGKSTLLKIAAGIVDADAGERFVQPGTTIRYLPQGPDFKGHKTTLSYVEEGLAPGDDPHRAQYLLSVLGLTGDEAPERLSGGEARRAALARVLAPEPDVLLLDEPTNHLDLPAIQWLEAELAAMSSAVIVISHDRRFLETVSKATLWIDRGRVRRLDQGFAKFEEWRDETFEQETVERHKLDRKIAAEDHWLIYGVTARRKRNQRRLRELQDMREQRRTLRHATGNVKMTVAQADSAGKLVAEAEGVSKSFGARAVIDDFSIRIQRGDRVGFVGPNGAGKTTLLNILTGQDTPDLGMARIGVSVKMVTLDQKRESLDPSTRLSDALTGGSGDSVSVAGEPRHVISYMKDFLFAPEQAPTPIGELSGGELGRLMLARALARPSNLLVLDEPTNDLDLETLDLLQDMLADYRGAVLLVSHDRDFLDRVVTSVVHAEGNGKWQEYAGGFSDMMIQRRNKPDAPPKPDGGKDAHKPAGPGGKQPEPGEKQGQKRKLSFNQTHALKTLPAKIADLEAKIESLRKALADPTLYARDRATFDKTAKALEQAETDLARMEEEWLQLEVEREAIEGA
ncbi:MAG: ABC-F family ATP-binding cassette domain-containing protein [Rhodospirillaceae bacterium]